MFWACSQKECLCYKKYCITSHTILPFRSDRASTVRDMAAHTKLKFRYGARCAHFSLLPSLTLTVGVSLNEPTLWQSEPLRQPGQTSVSEVKKVNLHTELLAAEADACAKKRKAAGLPVEDVSSAVLVAGAIEDAEVKKRRKVLQDALEMDKDADRPVR